MVYPAPGPQPLYPALSPRPPKNFQPTQPPPTQSSVTPATCTCFKETALLFNVQLNCFVNFILCPTDKYMFKVNNKKIRLICWMCSNIKLNTTWHRLGVFIVDFDQSQYISIVFLLLTLNKHVSVGCERQVIMFWKQKKRHICFVLKVHGLFQSAIYIIAPNWNYEQMTILWTYCRVVGSFFMVMGEGWVKMSATMIGRRQKIYIKKKLAKTPYSSPQKRNLVQNINDSKSHI